MSKAKDYIFNFVKEELENLPDETIIELHNEYCRENGYSDDEILSNEDNELNMHFTKPTELLQRALYGDYRYMDKYFVFNSYANLDSFNYPFDGNSPIQLRSLTEWIIDNDFNSDTLESYYDSKFDSLADLLRENVKENIEQFSDEELIELAEILYLDVEELND